VHRIAFIGSGQMATALAKGWIQACLIDVAQSRASDPSESARAAFARATGLPVAPDNAAAVAGAEIVVLAVKPQMMPAVLKELKSELDESTLVVSIAAGVTLKALNSGLGEVSLIRVMPNTPCLVGASASAFAANAKATLEHKAVVQKLFSAVGLCVDLPEKLLDAVTGLSGSGPAYVYLMIEAMADGGVKMGLPRDVALKLAAQTVLGSAKMVIETGSHPAALKDAVASPGGTTIAGLHELELEGVRGAFMNAVEAATQRATELGAQNPK
jgi:pyrroline-5-carboxylate reductase